jgi:DNA-binding beta-propeller fold protein YncE
MKKITSGFLILSLTLLLVFTFYHSQPVQSSDVTGAAADLYLPLLTSNSNNILILNGQITPHALAVKTGATVRWINQDTVPHTLTSDDGTIISPALNPGQSFSWIAAADGNYHVYSVGHPATEGAVIVSPNGTPDWFDGNNVTQAYQDSCSGCHGPNREGGIGPALIPDRLTELDSFYFDAIKNGRPGTLMPPWGTMGMSDAEIWLLIGLMRTEPAGGNPDWTLPQIADSLTILVDESTLPGTPTHTGDLDNLMLVTEREARRITVINGDNHQILGQIDASYRAHGYAFDPTNQRWVYNIGRDGWLFKIDMYTLQATRKIRVGIDSRGLAISDDGQYLIAGNYIPNTAVILDAQTLEPLKLITTEGYDPDGQWVESRVAIVSDVAPSLVGPYFIIALKEAGQVWRINFSQPTFPIDKLENVGHILHDGFLSPDNTRFYLASQGDNWMAVIDVPNWQLVTQIPTGNIPHPGSGAVWEDNGIAYGATTHAGQGLVSIWNLSTNQIVAQIPTAGPGLFIRTQEQSPYLWADALLGSPPNNIYIISKQTMTITHVINDGIQTLHPELTNDWQFVYISDWQGNVVRVYNAQTFALVAELTGIVTPTGIFNTSRRYEMLGH